MNPIHAASEFVVDIPVWVTYTVAAASFLTACGVIWRKALRPLVNGVTKIADRIEIVNEVPEKLATLTHSVSVLARTVDRIDKRTRELEPNAGSSMHDRIRRIDEALPPKENP